MSGQKKFNRLLIGLPLEGSICLTNLLTYPLFHFLWVLYRDFEQGGHNYFERVKVKDLRKNLLEEMGNDMDAK